MSEGPVRGVFDDRTDDSDVLSTGATWRDPDGLDAARPDLAPPDQEGGSQDDDEGGNDEGRDDEGRDDEEDVALVRPYSRIGGRTRSSFDLAIEALVSCTEHATDPDLDPEHQPIAQLCREVRSVAEVAALMRVPLGVARILLADMAELGLIRVHRTAHLGSGAPPIGILERVLAGLRRL